MNWKVNIKWHFYITPIFDALCLIKLGPIFVGSLDFSKKYKNLVTGCSFSEALILASIKYFQKLNLKLVKTTIPVTKAWCHQKLLVRNNLALLIQKLNNWGYFIAYDVVLARVQALRRSNKSRVERSLLLPCVLWTIIHLVWSIRNHYLSPILDSF